MMLAETLAALLELARPDLVIATGDLTHRGRPEQHATAAAALRALGPPVLAVPGNHDIPYTFPARLSAPWRPFEREWRTVEPTYATAELHVVGVNSVRPWRHQSGGVAPPRLARARSRLGEAAPGALRVVALHHQLIGAPWRTRKRPVAARTRVLDQLVAGGAQLIVSGHIHQAAAGERREFEVGAGESQSAVLTVAPGLGRPRPSRRGEARGCLVYQVDDRTISVDTYIARSDDWALTATRTFPRRADRLS
jgi:3',5'-cyclic AMP phosphodiesterase CpdA